MAEHAHITPPLSRRRSLFAAAGAVILSTGITAGVAASVADLVPAEVESDAALLSLRAELLAAVTEMGWSEMVTEISDEKLYQVVDRLRDACWEIADAPAAQTADGLALKAAAAMYRLRDGFSAGEWPGEGEEMAWNVLSQIAGDFYVSPALPERLRADSEPARA